MSHVRERERIDVLVTKNHIASRSITPVLFEAGPHAIEKFHNQINALLPVVNSQSLDLHVTQLRSIRKQHRAIFAFKCFEVLSGECSMLLQAVLAADLSR